MSSVAPLLIVTGVAAGRTFPLKGVVWTISKPAKLPYCELMPWTLSV